MAHHIKKALFFCALYSGLITKAAGVNNLMESDREIQTPELKFEATGNHDFFDSLRGNTLDSSQDKNFDLINNFLMQALLQPWPQGNGPLLYMEEEPQDLNNNAEQANDDLLFSSPMKRSRYNRKQPWRRVYKPQKTMTDRFICSPSKEDIFRLLVALHEIRKGKGEQIVNICNKKRPVHLVFSNIRLLTKQDE